MTYNVSSGTFNGKLHCCSGTSTNIIFTLLLAKISHSIAERMLNINM